MENAYDIDRQFKQKLDDIYTHSFYETVKTQVDSESFVVVDHTSAASSSEHM